jgi:hypothetical protein
VPLLSKTGLTDGLDVFRAFYDDVPLDRHFVLADSRTEYTPREIQELIRGT